MDRHVSLAITVLIGTLFVSGCSPTSTPTNYSAALDAPPKSQNQNNIALSTLSPAWKTTGKSFLIQGKIVKLNDKTPYSLKIHLDSVLYPGQVTPRPKFPKSIGSTVTVYFKQPFAQQGSMKPKNGEEVILGVTRYTVQPDGTLFWGSDASHYFYKKSGNFYGENGYELGIAT